MGDLMQEKNLNIEKVKEISKLKQEPEWMTEFRVNAYNTFVLLLVNQFYQKYP